MRKTKVLHNMRFMGSKTQQIKQTVESKNKSEIIPLSSGSPDHFPAVCLKEPAFPSLFFQSDLTQRLCHPSLFSNKKSKNRKNNRVSNPRLKKPNEIIFLLKKSFYLNKCQASNKKFNC